MTLVVLKGDGIGPAVTDAAMRVLRAVGWNGDIIEAPFGCDHWRRTGEALPQDTIQLIKQHKLAFMGAAETPAEGCTSPVLQLRQALGLDLMVRPVRLAGSLLTVVGHHSDGLYGQVEVAGPPARYEWVVTEQGAARLMAEAFARARTKVTLVDKPTVMRAAAKIFSDAAAEYRDRHATYEAINADAFVAAVLKKPECFDVLVATSFVADVISDLLAELSGGIGCAPSANYGPHCALFEPVHGTAPKHAAQEPLRANPQGAILSVAMLLEYIGETALARRVEWAMGHATEELGVCTPDRGGEATTEEVTAAVVAALS